MSRGETTTVVGVRLPDVVIKAILKDDGLKGESVGLRIRGLLVELFGEGAEPVDVRTAKAI
jgi:hypothetical protein